MLLNEEIDNFLTLASLSAKRFLSLQELEAHRQECLRLIELCDQKRMGNEVTKLAHVLPHFGATPDYIQDILAINALKLGPSEKDRSLLARLVLRCVEDPDFTYEMTTVEINDLKNFFLPGDRSTILHHPLLSDRCQAWLLDQT